MTQAEAFRVCGEGITRIISQSSLVEIADGKFILGFCFTKRLIRGILVVLSRRIEIR
jgi:hypothetical protein